MAVFPAAHFLHFCSISSRSQTFPFGAKRPFVSKPFAGIWGLHSQRGGEQSAGLPECGVCAVQTQGFTRMPKFGAKEDSGKRTSPPLPTPPASIATFCTIPTFPKAKRRAGSGPPPPALFGEKTPLFGLSATVAAKGGEGAAQPRPHKAPGTGAAPRMEEGRSRRTCAAAHRPAPLPAPSRGAPTRGVCAHTGGGGQERTRVHSARRMHALVPAVPSALARALRAPPTSTRAPRTCSPRRLPSPAATRSRPPHTPAGPPSRPRPSRTPRPPPATPPLPLHQWPPPRAVLRSPPALPLKSLQCPRGCRATSLCCPAPIRRPRSDMESGSKVCGAGGGSPARQGKEGSYATWCGGSAG